MTPRIRSWRLQPPRGGWGVPYYVGGHQMISNSRKPEQVVREVYKFGVKGGKIKSIGDAWDYCNDIWTKRDPERAMPSERPRGPVAKISKTPETSPSKFGPHVWNWLALYGMSTPFVKSSWIGTIKQVENLLNPSYSPKTGCSRCFNSWKLIISNRPPSLVSSSKEAAVWVFKAHNDVNEKLEKPLMKWEDAVIKYDWCQ